MTFKKAFTSLPQEDKRGYLLYFQCHLNSPKPGTIQESNNTQNEFLNGKKGFRDVRHAGPIQKDAFLRTGHINHYQNKKHLQLHAVSYFMLFGT